MNFFRKYQKPILFTAVLFALVTFSISTEMMNFFSDMFRPPEQRTMMTLEGRNVEVTDEDLNVARALSQRGTGVVSILPQLSLDRSNNDLVQVLAVLRRQAIEAGIDASYAEVDRAIDAASQSYGIEDRRTLAAGFSSWEAFRRTVHEAMRIATLVRLQSLGAMQFDYEAVALALEDKEVVTARVASLDKKVLEDEFAVELDKAEDPGQVVRAWLDGLELTDNNRMKFSDTNRVLLTCMAVAISEFDPAQFETELAGFEIADAEVESFHTQNQATLFKNPKWKAPESGTDGQKDDDKGEKKRQTEFEPRDESTPDKPVDEKPVDETPADDKPADDKPVTQDPVEPEFLALDDALKATIRKRLQAQQVLEKFRAKVDQERFATLEPSLRARNEALDAKAAALTARDEAKLAAAAAESDVALAGALEAAEQSLKAAETALEAADDAVEAQRAEFDVAAMFQREMAGRSGIRVVRSGDAPKTPTELEKIEGLGAWSQSWSVSRATKGQLSSAVQHTDEAAFVFAVDQVETPFKDWETIKDDVRKAYLESKADEAAKSKRETFEKELEKLAREVRATEIAAIEAEQSKQVDEQLAAWRTGLETRITETEALLAGTTIERARRSYEDRIAKVREELAGDVAKRQELEKAIAAETEAKIKADYKKAYKDVLARAAETAGFTISTIGPQLRNPPRFGSIQHLPAIDQFVFHRADVLRDLEVGDATDVLDDFSGRAVRVVVVDAVEPASVNNLTRRELLQLTSPSAQAARIQMGVAQSFSREALEKRLGMRMPGDEEARPD